MEPFSDKDTAIEILSRLPAKSLVAFKCTAKRWYNFVSDPSFLRIHDKSRSKDEMLGLLVQKTFPNPESTLQMSNFLLILTASSMLIKYKVLDFLPEKVVFISSSNGILCCRSCIETTNVSPHWKKNVFTQKKFFVYVCNPATREWIKIKRDTSRMAADATLLLGFAFYPFCSTTGGSSFKLVNLQHLRSDPDDTYSFIIYSSETRRWKKSKEVIKFSSNYIYPTRVIFTNGRLHWLTRNHHIITFHVEKEFSKVIKLPGVTPNNDDNCQMGICLGESSEGYLSYVCAFETELHVWVLKNYEEEPPTWECKHCVFLAEFYDKYSSALRGNGAFTRHCRYTVCRHLNRGIEPLAFYGDVLYARIYVNRGFVISYDFKTGTFVYRGIAPAPRGISNIDHLIVHPYRHSLVRLPLVAPRSPSVLTRNKKRKFVGYT